MDYTTLPERIDAYLSKHATKDSYHWQGRSVIMPSGSGKSYYVESVQKKVEWLDADPIMWAVGAMPPPKGKDRSGLTWEKDEDEIMKRCDKVTDLLKKKRLWVMGATWWSMKKIDAIVVLPKNLNKKYLAAKENAFADDYYEKELEPYIKNTLLPQAKKESIAVHSSIEAVVKYIRSVDSPYE